MIRIVNNYRINDRMYLQCHRTHLWQPLMLIHRLMVSLLWLVLTMISLVLAVVTANTKNRNWQYVEIVPINWTVKMLAMNTWTFWYSCSANKKKKNDFNEEVKMIFTKIRKRMVVVFRIILCRHWLTFIGRSAAVEIPNFALHEDTKSIMCMV